MLKSKIRKKRKTCARRGKKNQWEKKKQQKSAHSFCKKNVSSLHLEIWAVLGDGTVTCCFICTILAPCRVLSNLSQRQAAPRHGGLTRLPALVCSHSGWMGPRMALPFLCCFQDYSDVGYWTHGRDQSRCCVWSANSRRARAPMRAPVGHLVAGQASPSAGTWTEPWSDFCFYCRWSCRNLGTVNAFSRLAISLVVCCTSLRCIYYRVTIRARNKVGGLSRSIPNLGKHAVNLANGFCLGKLGKLSTQHS